MSRIQLNIPIPNKQGRRYKSRLNKNHIPLLMSQIIRWKRGFQCTHRGCLFNRFYALFLSPGTDEILCARYLIFPGSCIATPPGKALQRDIFLKIGLRIMPPKNFFLSESKSGIKRRMRLSEVEKPLNVYENVCCWLSGTYLKQRKIN